MLTQASTLPIDCLKSPYELRRLQALHELNLLDTAPSDAFDRITRMAARLFGVAVAAVSSTGKSPVFQRHVRS
jgi:hypothetical protein